LMDKNKKDEAKRVFKYIAKFNNRQNNIDQINKIIDEYKI